MDGFIRVENVRKVYQSGRDSVEAVSGVSFVADKASSSPFSVRRARQVNASDDVRRLEQITSGKISIADSLVTSPRTSVGVMFQDSTLLPGNRCGRTSSSDQNPEATDGGISRACR